MKAFMITCGSLAIIFAIATAFVMLMLLWKILMFEEIINPRSGLAVFAVIYASVASLFGVAYLILKMEYRNR